MSACPLKLSTSGVKNKLMFFFFDLFIYYRLLSEVVNLRCKEYIGFLILISILIFNLSAPALWSCQPQVYRTNWFFVVVFIHLRSKEKAFKTENVARTNVNAENKNKNKRIKIKNKK
jgi:hypothetical protein